MVFEETRVAGAFVVDLQPRHDERGFFARAWCGREFAEHGIHASLRQANIAFSHRKGTLRGMHYTVGPHGEAKLVRCVRGAMHDVIVDLRPGSPTFRQWAALELSADNRRLLFVPPGVAHGYQTLVDDTETLYLVSLEHAPELERGVRWDDPAFEIEWPPEAERLISIKDRGWPPFTHELRYAALTAESQVGPGIGEH